MLSMVPIWGPVASSDNGSLDIALNEFPMRDLRKDLSCAAHECAVRRRIETQAIGHPRGGVAKIAINADQAGRRGCGIAARLTRNVIMRLDRSTLRSVSGQCSVRRRRTRRATVRPPAVAA